MVAKLTSLLSVRLDVLPEAAAFSANAMVYDLQDYAVGKMEAANGEEISVCLHDNRWFLTVHGEHTAHIMTGAREEVLREYARLTSVFAETHIAEEPLDEADDGQTEWREA